MCIHMYIYIYIYTYICIYIYIYIHMYIYTTTPWNATTRHATSLRSTPWWNIRVAEQKPCDRILYLWPFPR